MLDQLFAQKALLFTVPALLGTVVFLMKLGLMALGGIGGGLDVDIDTDVDVDLGEAVEGGDSTEAFNLLSIQSMAAFLMGFGWGGLGGYIGMDWSMSMSLLVGAAFGAGMIWLLGMLMKGMYDLQNSGNIAIGDAIGSEGEVYVGVPRKGEGSGQVRLIIAERARIYNAISEGEAIERHARVRVIRVNPDNTVTVSAV